MLLSEYKHEVIIPILRVSSEFITSVEKITGSPNLQIGGKQESGEYESRAN
ncbi:hypothetical protein [Nostoc sp.]